MEAVRIKSDIIEAKEFNHINAYLANWDLSPVEGKALYAGAMNRAYAHLKIKMYKSLNNDSNVIWNVPEIELPIEFRSTIVAGLSFFLNYLEGIKGQSILLTFEINDGGYHAVDSELAGFNRVTTRAIISCFDPDHFEFKAHRVFRQTSFRGYNAEF
ncbi:hypothetical protein DBR43_15025 [Pedobacter sp. KBW06]|uniref:hypothetical protein n=1 Tax=Pedobacter sp. KBW06 TaxID=2153359 RepID=UPI000F5917B2|nr:hypothetical protein [Pedobacter sp. KBW06]RQO69396.1 hypothetical protein DBR43_15025 [Pedobacter sp. KBW06]